MIQLKILQVQMLLMLYHISSLLRIIPIKDNDKFKSNKLELGVITINLSNIRSTDETQLYKNIFKTTIIYILIILVLYILCDKNHHSDICFYSFF